MAPKTGSKKLVETWRPERDLDCSRRDQKRARPKTGAPNPRVGACDDPVFGVATCRSERTQLLQKFARNHETTKGRKNDTNIHVLN